MPCSEHQQKEPVRRINPSTISQVIGIVTEQYDCRAFGVALVNADAEDLQNILEEPLAELRGAERNGDLAAMVVDECSNLEDIGRWATDWDAQGKFVLLALSYSQYLELFSQPLLDKMLVLYVNEEGYIG